jgi:hypothetical protein
MSQKLCKRPCGNPLSPIFPSKPIRDLRFAFLFVTRNTACNIPVEEDRPDDAGINPQDLVPMGHKGFAVRWIFRGKCRHGVGFPILLLRKEDRQIIGQDIAQKKFMLHTVFSP